jgi:hypothetical protein
MLMDFTQNLKKKKNSHKNTENLFNQCNLIFQTSYMIFLMNQDLE